jgi:hypothetical protein
MPRFLSKKLEKKMTINIKNCITYFLIFIGVYFVPPIYANTVDIFVMAGQSNMHGFQGDASQYPIDKKPG